MDVKEEEEHEKTLLSGEEQKEEGEQKLPSRVGGWIGWVGSRLGGTFTLQPEDLQSEKVGRQSLFLFFLFLLFLFLFLSSFFFFLLFLIFECGGVGFRSNKRIY